jgi:hypothetical protein
MSGVKKFFHWGNVIWLVFAVFAAGMGFMVYRTFKTPVNLVADNYYEEELRYQDKIDGQNNAAKISDMKVSQDEHNVIVVLPKEIVGKKIEGNIKFYCTSDGKKDVNFKIAVDSTGKQIIPQKEVFPNTLYKIQVTYKADSTAYFSEKEIRTK